MKKYLMKCGHVAQAVRPAENNKPVCIICSGPEREEIETNLPKLEGREAKCNCCNKTVKSSLGLPFFEYREEKERDYYYCGCMGWD